MANYVVKNSATPGNIPIYETDTNTIDVGAVMTFSIPGYPTASDPLYVLNNDTTTPRAYAYHLGQFNVKYWRDPAMSGMSVDGVIGNSQPQVLFCAVRYKTDAIDRLYYYIGLGSVETFVEKYNSNNLGTDGLIFSGNYADYSANIEEIRDWDETPEQDGDNTEDVEGGENADTDPFDFTQNQSVWPDPDLDFISPYAYDAGGNPIPGLYTPYELTPTQLQALGAVLYDSDMFDTLVQKLNGSSNPISGILRCIQIPVVTNLGSGSYNIAVFGEELHSENHANPTGAHLRGRWVTKEGGSVTLKEVWGTARDYTDTQVSIYLPFVGVRQLDPQLCVGKTLSLRCYIDAYTGDVLWLLRSSNSGIGGKFYESGGFIGRWSGNCATEIPIGRIDNTRALATLIGGLSGVVMAPFTGGASLAATGASLTGMLTGGAQSMGVVSGNVTGHLGTADVLYPYLIVQRSVPDYPKSWRAKIGAAKNDTYQANALTGYTLFSQIFLENMEGASGEEIEALKNELCTEGIIL